MIIEANKLTEADKIFLEKTGIEVVKNTTIVVRIKNDTITS